MAQDSSATQVSSQTPIATITSTGEAGEIEGGCFCSNVSYFEIKKSALMIYGPNWFCKNRTKRSSIQFCHSSELTNTDSNDHEHK